ncbi:agmatine deiminase family protein [Sphingosinicella sp.]|uniref:agmatine deiminase family protein n=1 Tax=Sphingosinicella sp. TaxID=1917971 RepID=UPI0040384AD2
MIFRQPAEWAPHEAVWIGFPSHADLWEDDLEPARAEVAAFARIVHAGGKGEEVRLVAADPDSVEAAKALAPFATVIQEPFGDIWLRDTGPIILTGAGDRRAARFRFNGWGGKYELEGDDTIGLRLAETIDLDAAAYDWVLEGGAIDVDGTGLALATEQCLLNPNRNPAMSKADVEARLRAELGIDRVLWLGDGLLNDHTDGHVDNLARFVAEGVLAIPTPTNDDPNAAVYEDARARAETFGLEATPLPSPGRIERDGEIIPASYMNFYIGNAAVAVPIYGAANDDAAVAAIAKLFPGRHVEGYRADHILTGGGSFHCISQQVPR